MVLQNFLQTGITNPEPRLIDITSPVPTYLKYLIAATLTPEEEIRLKKLNGTVVS